MKNVWISGTFLLAVGLTALGVEPGAVLKNAAQKFGGALCRVDCELTEGDASQTLRGVGVCIDPSGLVLTTVLPQQILPELISKIELTLPGPDGKKLPATFLGSDPLAGISFLRAKEAHSWTAVVFQNRANVSIGDLVVSLGVAPQTPTNSLSLGMGYISGLQRSPSPLCRITGGTLSGMGSVVFNIQGQAIGLVIAQPFHEYQMYTGKGKRGRVMLRDLEQATAFLPVEEFADVLTNIHAGGVVRRPSWIGAVLTAAPESLIEAKGVVGPAVMVDQLLSDGPAKKAGLRARDLIVGFNGAPLEDLGSPGMTADGLNKEIGRTQAGQNVTLTVLRNGQRRDLSVRVEPMPKLPYEVGRLADRQLGFLLREKVVFDQLNRGDPAADMPGLLVLVVISKSPADQAGLKQGDLILAWNGQGIVRIDAAKKKIQEILDRTPPGNLHLTVQRGAGTEELTIEAPRK